MPRRSLPWLASLLLTIAAPCFAATVLERTVLHAIDASGNLDRTEVQKVRLDHRADRERWSSYAVLLDENVELLGMMARATRPDGEKIVIGKKDRDTREVALGGALHSSTSLEVAEFPPLETGTLIEVGHEVRERPYFPAGAISLRGGDPVEKLRIEIRGASGLRWTIDGSREGLEVQATDNTVIVTGRDLPGVTAPRNAPARSPTYPVLRYAWGADATWSDVGRWYESLLSGLDRGAGSVGAEAARLMAGRTDPWERLEALVQFAQRDVRYVAVEVGIGGFRPSAPPQTLERKWGDCKDKSLLLIEMLRAAQIEAYPALILSADDERTDVDFPTPFGFNHLIVALPAREWMRAPGLPLASGFLFVDPTQTRGGPKWLGASTQGQHALVVRGAESQLVRTPLLPASEARDLTVELTILSGGGASGTARYAMTGNAAAAWFEQMATAPAERTEEDVRDVFDDLIPGAVLGTVSWEGVDTDVPSVRLEARFQLERMLEGSPGRRSFRVPAVTRTPSPRIFAGRELPVVVRPVASRSAWTIRLPHGACLPEQRDERTEHAIGTFRHSVVPEDRSVRIERRLELRDRWVEPEEFAGLKALSVAEHRASKRRIRLKCDAE